MSEAFICDPVRTAIGRYGGTLSSVRTDDLGAVPIKALIERNSNVDWEAVDDVIYGNANQAGECNRDIARRSARVTRRSVPQLSSSAPRMRRIAPPRPTAQARPTPV